MTDADRLLDLMRRIEGLERDMAEHRRDLRKLETLMAVADNRLTSVRERTVAVEANASKLVWLVIASLVSAAGVWIIKGGLMNV